MFRQISDGGHHDPQFIARKSQLPDVVVASSQSEGEFFCVAEILREILDVPPTAPGRHDELRHMAVHERHMPSDRSSACD